MTTALPGAVPAGHGNLLHGTVTLTNRGPAPVAGITSTQPDVWVVRDGRVVAVPAGVRPVGVDLDLAPGESRTFEAVVNLGRCRPDGTAPGDPRRAAPLPPGRYETYAVQQIACRPGPAAGDTLLVVGGPWPLVIG